MSLGRLTGLEHDVDHISSWTLSQQQGCFGALTSAWAQHGCLMFVFGLIRGRWPASASAWTFRVMWPIEALIPNWPNWPTDIRTRSSEGLGYGIDLDAIKGQGLYI
ncbi:hypothetical protein PCH_Pc21g16910 [Penicillium rubens Wisconsin 54-1255]|uniref:Uncharacterized protein n=1 Tax=Penicillium rubens (strain ATCC 28089 / DSM 1075 / NRRL 1951 / Wisconsin 54-1255) TaxID=500485 RepID=B6HLR7_PENRW|nr:hypothetical protein PCH_Pc21g16910 [Penicillium rubens Wisconsin 54-1255]